MKLFPLECIFFEKLELKLCWETERCIKFPMFKDKNRALKEPTWKQIEPQTLKLRNSHFNRELQSENLFAREAWLHPSAHKSFSLTEYANYRCDTVQATNCNKTDSDHARPIQSTEVRSWKHDLRIMIFISQSPLPRLIQVTQVVSPVTCSTVSVADAIAYTYIKLGSKDKYENAPSQFNSAGISRVKANSIL